jgi:hypothetical protein
VPAENVSGLLIDTLDTISLPLLYNRAFAVWFANKRAPLTDKFVSVPNEVTLGCAAVKSVPVMFVKVGDATTPSELLPNDRFEPIPRASNVPELLVDMAVGQ